MEAVSIQVGSFVSLRRVRRVGLGAFPPRLVAFGIAFSCSLVVLLLFRLAGREGVCLRKGFG